MSILIPLSLAKKHLNIETSFTDDDDYITELIDICLESIKVYCDQDWLDIDFTLPANTGLTELRYPEPIKWAALLMVSHLYNNREPVSFGSAIKIPYSYELLLNPYINYNRTSIENE
jgi:hypothetical protein